MTTDRPLAHSLLGPFARAVRAGLGWRPTHSASRKTEARAAVQCCPRGVCRDTPGRRVCSTARVLRWCISSAKVKRTTMRSLAYVLQVVTLEVLHEPRPMQIQFSFYNPPPSPANCTEPGRVLVNCTPGVRWGVPHLPAAGLRCGPLCPIIHGITSWASPSPCAVHSHGSNQVARRTAKLWISVVFPGIP